MKYRNVKQSNCERETSMELSTKQLQGIGLALAFISWRAIRLVLRLKDLSMKPKLQDSKKSQSVMSLADV